MRACDTTGNQLRQLAVLQAPGGPRASTPTSSSVSARSTFGSPSSLICLRANTLPSPAQHRGELRVSPANALSHAASWHPVLTLAHSLVDDAIRALGYLLQGEVGLRARRGPCLVAGCTALGYLQCCRGCAAAGGVLGIPSSSPRGTEPVLPSCAPLSAGHPGSAGGWAAGHCIDGDGDEKPSSRPRALVATARRSAGRKAGSRRCLEEA